MQGSTPPKNAREHSPQESKGVLGAHSPTNKKKPPKKFGHSPNFSDHNFFFIDKSRNLLKFVLVLLSASVERVGVSRMRDFFLSDKAKTHVDVRTMYTDYGSLVHCEGISNL